MNTTRHIEAMQHTSRALEELGRRIGYYSKDCDTLNDAVKAGRSGFVVILDEAGEVAEIHAIGAASAEIGIEKTKPGNWDITLPNGNNYNVISPYEMVEGNAFELAAAQSHEPGRRNSPPTTHVEGNSARTAPKATADAARIAKLSASYKADRAAGIERTARIAAQMKEASEKIHGR